MSPRRLGTWMSAAAFGLAAMTPACGVLGPTAEPPANPDAGGAYTGNDGGAEPSPFDAGVSLPDATTPVRDEYDPTEDLAAAREGCFDGVDNDGDGVMDCDDASCQANVPSCCVGSSSDVCCVPDIERALPFEGCGGDLSTCAAVTGAGFDVFGSDRPRAETIDDDPSVETFVPGGAISDSGVLFPERLDPRAGTIRLTATIAASDEPPPDGTVDAIAVGLVDASVDPSSLARVSPVAAVVVSRNRGEVSLVVAGETVQRWALSSPSFHDYTLTLAPDGVVSLASTLFATTEPVATARLLVDRPLRMVVYGRTPNLTANPAPRPARASFLALSTDRCDMPGALTRSDPMVVPSPEDLAWAVDHPSITSPHAIAYEDPPGTTREAMALTVDGEIHLASPIGGGFSSPGPFAAPAFDPTGLDWASDGVSDPALRWTDAGLELWLTGWAGETGTVARARWDEPSGQFVEPQVVFDPAASVDIDAFDGVAPFELGGALHAVVRERRQGGDRIALYALDGPSPVRRSEVARTSGEMFSFDRDEIAAPAAIVVDDVIRVYYGGRRGTRWSIGLRVSDDASHWRTPDGSPVLRESGEGFDAIGVFEPSPVMVDGALLLYYAGFDGARVRVGVAR